MKGFRIERPELKEHIDAIGHICIEWSHLEGSVDYLLSTLVPIQTGKVFDCITTNADFRAKLQMVKGIALSHRVTWYNDLQKVVDYTDNTLRPARNRYIHDVWVVGGGRPQKMEQAMRIRRPQAHAEPVLETMHFREVDIEEMWGVIYRITMAAGWIWQTAIEHQFRRKPNPAPPAIFGE